MSESSDTLTPTQKEQENRRIVRSGCATGLGCLGFVVIPLLGYTAFSRFIVSATLGTVTPDLLTLYAPEEHTHVMVWTALVAPIAAFSLMAIAKSWTRMILYGLLALSLGAALVFQSCYSKFLAIRLGRNSLGHSSEVELIYLWPHPSVRIDLQGAVVAIEMVTSKSDDATALVDRLVVEKNGQTYRSSESGAAMRVKAVLLSRGAKGGELR